MNSYTSGFRRPAGCRRECFLFAASGAAILLILNLVAARINPMVLSGADLPIDSPGVEAVTIGSSVNRAIDFGVLGLDGREAWLGGSDLYEAASLIRRSNLPELRLILFGLPELVWPTDNARASPGSRLSFYWTVSPQLGWEPVLGDWRNLIIARYLPLRRPDAWSGVVRKILETLGLLQPLAPNSGDFSSEPLAVSAPRIAAERRTRLRRSPLDDLQLQRALDDLSALAGWARQRGAVLVVYQPPTWKGYLSELVGSDPAYSVRLRKQQEALASLPGIIYYREPGSKISLQPNLFSDAFHLNSNGARVFSANLKRHLEKLAVLEDLTTPVP